jgi:hypothetical protein
LFIAEGDEADSGGDAGFGDFDHGDPDDAEDHGDVKFHQAGGYEVRASRLWGGHVCGTVVKEVQVLVVNKLIVTSRWLLPWSHTRARLRFWRLATGDRIIPEVARHHT